VVVLECGFGRTWSGMDQQEGAECVHVAYRGKCGGWGGFGPAPCVGDVGWARCSRRWCIEVNPCIPFGVTALGGCHACLLPDQFYANL
jgi:hypothetical protein